MSRTKIVAAAMAGTLAVTTIAPTQPAFAQTASDSSDSSSESSSEIGSAIGALVLIAVLMGPYGWFSPYNQNGAWANAYN